MCGIKATMCGKHAFRIKKGKSYFITGENSFSVE